MYHVINFTHNSTQPDVVDLYTSLDLSIVVFVAAVARHPEMLWSLV